MDTLLPDEALLQPIDEKFPCREAQTRQLACLIWPAIPSPPTIIVHGLEATGKTSIVHAVLEAVGTPHTVIKCRECITARHLFELTITAVEGAIAETLEQSPSSTSGRCESMTMLTLHLQKLLQGLPKFVLVLDGIDHQREAPATLLPALVRLGEILPSLTTVLVINIPHPRFLRLSGIPYVHFPNYTRQEALTIISAKTLPIYGRAEPENALSPGSPTIDDDSVWLWSRFCEAVWDTIAKGAANDIISFHELCRRLWRPFMSPVVEGVCGARDLSRLMVLKRDLFKDESVLVEGVVPNIAETGKGSKDTHELSFYSKYLLCAAYLASHNPARQDPVFFMRATEKKRRKKGGGTAAGRGRGASKHRKIQRRLLGPQAFVLERMLAIFHAILPFPMSSITADLQTQISTLLSLRLLVRQSGSADVLEAQTKWRVNVGWDYILRIADSLRFDIVDYVAE